MKVISFLGNSNYSPTIFYLGEMQRHTRFFPAAVAQFLVPELLLVCVTPAVRQHPNLAELGQELDTLGVPWRPLDIPEGRSEADLWQIFDALTGAVEEDDTVAFDVTHSFRSLPMLAFLAVAYLKAAKRVKVERVLYGAYEARVEDRSPVFDLTPFVSLLDWLAATNRFVETGDGHALAGLLAAGMPGSAQMKQDAEARALGRKLKLAADAIESISLALRLSRPLEAMQSAAKFDQVLRAAMPGIQERARPFGLLAEQVNQEYSQFGLEQISSPDEVVKSLWLQLEMVHWYNKRRHVVQAATLAREWLVSLLAFHFGLPIFDYKAGREAVEYALNNAVERLKPNPHLRDPGPCDELLTALPQVGEMSRVWSQMSEVRNDIAHCGFRKSPTSARQLKQKVEALYPQLVSLAKNLLPKDSPADENMVHNVSL